MKVNQDQNLTKKTKKIHKMMKMIINH
jgi:hypothetical protein